MAKNPDRRKGNDDRDRKRRRTDDEPEKKREAELRAQLDATRQELAKARLTIQEYDAQMQHLQHQLVQVQGLAAALPPGPIVQLLPEMLWSILSFLDLEDLLHCELVCQQWAINIRAWLASVDFSAFSARTSPQHIRAFLARHPNLLSISLAGCDIYEPQGGPRSPMLAEICMRAPRLRRLNLYGCTLADGLQSLKNMTHLRELYLGHNANFEPSMLASLPPTLTSLKLEWLSALGQEDELAGAALKLDHLTALESYTIDNCENAKGVDGLLPPAKPELVASLRSVSIRNINHFYDDAFERLAQFVNLTDLELSVVPARGFLSATLLERPNTSLRRLVLRHLDHLENSGLRAIMLLFPSIEELAIVGKTNLTFGFGEGLRHLSQLRHLKLRCSDALVDLDNRNTLCTMGFLEDLRLRTLVLQEATYLGRWAIETIARTQAETLEALELLGCRSLGGSDLANLQELTHLQHFRFEYYRDFATPTAPVPRVYFAYKDGGGIAFASPALPEAPPFEWPLPVPRVRVQGAQQQAAAAPPPPPPIQQQLQHFVFPNLMQLMQALQPAPVAVRRRGRGRNRALPTAVRGGGPAAPAPNNPPNDQDDDPNQTGDAMDMA